MRVNPYIEPLLHNITDLLNDAPAAPADVAERWQRRGMPMASPPDDEDLRVVRRYLLDWEQVVLSESQPVRVEKLNAMLRTYTAPPSITDHDGSGWHLHFRDPAVGFGATLAGATTAAAAQFLCDRGMHRLGRCASLPCTRAYVDVSRPGRQRYCCHRCANRDAVRRHRRG